MTNLIDDMFGNLDTPPQEPEKQPEAAEPMPEPETQPEQQPTQEELNSMLAYKEADEYTPPPEAEQPEQYSLLADSRLPENSEVRKIITNEELNLTDLGNTKRFLTYFKHNVIYVQQENQFRTWSGQIWKADPQKAQVSFLVEATVRSIYSEAEKAEQESVRKKLAKWAMQSESRDKRNSIIRDLEQHIDIVKGIEKFNQNPWMFNCANGTIDLRTGRLQPFDQFDYISKVSPVNYNKDADCPLWDKTLKLIFKDDLNLIDYVQRLCGYSMIGDVLERIIIFCFGDGGNGKSTLLETIFHIMGDYAETVKAETFLQQGYAQSGSNASPDIAKLHSARFVKTSEIPDGARFNESLIKDVTGKDLLTARNLYSRFFSFKPQFKVWMYGNHQPAIYGQDAGIHSRIKLIPFLHKFQIEDTSIQQRLLTEAPGILNWMISGCLRYQKEGLVQADLVTEYTNKYFEDNDPIGKFLKENYDITKQGYEKFSDVWGLFEQFPDSGRISKKKFAKILREKHNLNTIRGTGHIVYIEGISLKD
jgi:putative DNA primase/helicase